MAKWKKIETSAEVWAVIHARHNLQVFGSFSAPGGSPWGDPDQAEMQTSYCFHGSDWPLLEARTTWRIDRSDPVKRYDEKREYWLCYPIEDDRDVEIDV
jgi:hypothetical protein